MVDNDASFAGQWSASSSANPGHGKRQSSIGGRGRARSLSLNTKGKNSAASSPALSAITGGSWDPEGIEKLDINNGSRHGRIVSNPVPNGRSNSPSPGRISPPGMERENNTAIRNADTTASRSYAINIGMVDSGFSLTENNEHDPFGPSSQSSVRWGEGMKNPKVQQSFDAVNKHFLSPVKPIAIIGLGFYLFLLWTW
ncbi:hypothetical protein KEM55_006172 [Ascosphaera atra]|nr:hypothetical protein KEM55_006172 [Ascosphaera atra]